MATVRDAAREAAREILRDFRLELSPAARRAIAEAAADPDFTEAVGRMDDLTDDRDD